MRSSGFRGMVRAGALIAAGLFSLAAAAQDVAVVWEGTYTCSPVKGLFSGGGAAVSKLLRVGQRGRELQGQADAGQHQEAFNGSVSAGGEITFVADGFWLDDVQRTTSLAASGNLSGSQLLATGKRIETAGNRRREEDCVILLSKVVPATTGPSTPAVPQPASAPVPAPVDPVAVGPAPAVQAVQPPTAAVSPQPVSQVNRRRRALVIGNDNYRHVTPLRNARADARAMGNALAALGFAVTARMDVDERGLKEALRNFRAEIQGGDEIVLYFAGHGVQFSSANYLLPVDIRSEGEEQVRDESVALQRILDDFADRRTGFTLAIIDACRDNPFRTAGRSIGGRGLAPTSAATGQMVIFSAGAGQQALDRLGPADNDPNGLFTRVFLREMGRDGVPVDRVLRAVRSEVVNLARSVGHEQTPALYDQAVGDFFFRSSR